MPFAPFRDEDSDDNRKLALQDYLKQKYPERFQQAQFNQQPADVASHRPQTVQEQYDAASNDDELKSAQGDQKRAGNIGLLAEAFAKMGNSFGAARGGGDVDSGIFKRIGGMYDNDVANARTARKERQDGVLLKDKLGWEGEERGQQRTSWANAATDRTRMLGEQARNDALRDPNNVANVLRRKLGRQVLAKAGYGQDAAGITEDMTADQVDALVSQTMAAGKQRLDGRKTEAEIRGLDASAAKNQADARAAGLPKPKALGGEEKKRADHVREAVQAIDGMASALNKGDNTFSVVGDNDFTMNRSYFENAIGRMESGGVIGKDEVAQFRALAPTPSDSPEMQQKKLMRLRNVMLERAKTLGTEGEIGAMPQAPADTKTVGNVNYVRVPGGWRKVK